VRLGTELIETFIPHGESGNLSNSHGRVWQFALAKSLWHLARFSPDGGACHAISRHRPGLR
jgi:hypothetical protein